MGRSALQPPRAVADVLGAWGNAIRTARIRRRWRIADFATKSGVSESTLQSLERGHPGVGVGAYLSAMWALGMLDHAATLTDTTADTTGLVLDAQRQPLRARAPRARDDDF